MSATTRAATAALILLAVAAHHPSAMSEEPALNEVRVEADSERADGPVAGYRATRSATVTKTDTPIKDIPQSVTIVPSQMMEDAGMQSMSDVFRYVPGATWHQGEGNRDQVVLRGNSTTADFYVDGMRDDAQVFRDLYNLERVEVLKGPAGMIFGRGGAGGVVNRVTKRPVFEGIGDVNVTVGQYDQLRAGVDVGNKFNDSMAWRLNAMGETSDSFRDGVSMTRYAVNPTGTYLWSPETALTLGYEHLDDNRTADRGIPSQFGRPYATDASQFFGNAEQSDARSIVNDVYAMFDHDFGGGLKLKNSTRIAHYDKFYQNVYPGSAVNAAGTMTISAYNNRNLRTNLFNQTDLISKFNTGSMEHTLLTGIEVGHQHSDNLRNTGFFGAATGATVLATNPFATATRFGQVATDANNEVTADILGVYVQDQVAFTPQWKVIGGLRYDHFRTDFDDRRPGSVDLARTDNAVSPRIGLIWEPDSRSAIYISYSSAFLPSGEQLSLAPTTADLAPEKAKNYEVGARYDVLPKLSLSAAIYRTDRDNVKVADPNNPGFFIKTGKLRTEGIEVGLQGEVARFWQVYGGYSYMDGRVEQPFSSGTNATAAPIPAGNRLALTPENTFALWNKFDITPSWATAVGVIYQSSSMASITNAVELPGFTRVDAAVYYTFPGGKTRIALNIENLFDRGYFPTADGDNNISPGAPINARLTLSVGF